MVKLGGSVVTVKDRPFTPNKDVIAKLADVISKAPMPLLLVHGGGSFGHHVADRWKIGVAHRAVDPRGVAEVREAMLELNSIVLKSLSKAGVNAYMVPACSLFEGNVLLEAGVKLVARLLRNRLVPVTFGDVLVEPEGAQVVSGDTLMAEFAVSLGAKRAVFVFDKDGIYEGGGSSVRLAQEVTSKTSIANLGLKKKDVTGELQGKLGSAFRIAKAGVDVYFVNGFFPDRVLEALKGKVSVGSVIRGGRTARRI